MNWPGRSGTLIVTGTNGPFSGAVLGWLVYRFLLTEE